MRNIYKNRFVIGVPKSGKFMAEIIYTSRYMSRKKYPFNFIARRRYFKMLVKLWCDYMRGAI